LPNENKHNCKLQTECIFKSRLVASIVYHEIKTKKIIKKLKRKTKEHKKSFLKKFRVLKGSSSSCSDY